VAEAFPETPRASRAVRLVAIVIGLAMVALATRTTLTSLRWVGQTFPGFFLLPNRVVASIGLAGWSGGPDLYQRQVVAVDGVPVASAAEAYARIAGRPAGTPVRWRLRWEGEEADVDVPCGRFGWRDWALLFGAYLLNSAVYLAAGLVVWLLRPRAPLGRALLLFGGTCAVWMVTAMDLYAPGTFFRLHVVGESMFPATAFHLALLFPTPHPFARRVGVFYLLALAVLVPYELVLFDPARYTVLHSVATLYLGFGALLFGIRLVAEWLRGRSALARQRIRVMTLGTLMGFALPGAIFVASAATAGGVPVNTGAFTGFLFALALAYAVVKHDLFEIDAMVKRGAYYLLLTGAVGSAYVLAVVLFNLALPGVVLDSRAFPIAFTLAVLLVFNPLRSRLQTFVDRVFFRTHYDGAAVLDAVGAELASALTREQVAALVRDGVERAIPNGRTRLFAGDGGAALVEVGGATPLPAPLRPALAHGRVLTAFDAAESWPDPAQWEEVRTALVAIAAEVAVPMLSRGTLVGALVVGAKRSGLFYTAGDAAFLRALAHQAAISLQNAAAYEAMMQLNAQLEQRVAERTAQLVQSEKMAALGRLVAGVAHEINNPVSFVVTTVGPLRRRLARAAEQAPEAVRKSLADCAEIVDLMGRGAERTAAIVQDLRSFSRLGEAQRKPVDLHEGLEVSLRLLHSRWRDRVTIHRELGDLPLVECDPGQMNQVFMNLLANAFDAVGDGGNVWITTTRETDAAVIRIRDDGPGIAPDVIGRVFEPFFTTKDVGAGTGLGLAIAHGIVTAHGGRIDVASAAGAGATFTVRLPIAAAVALDSTASAVS
jgi:signal transduction histidine kinase